MSAVPLDEIFFGYLASETRLVFFQAYDFLH